MGKSPGKWIKGLLFGKKSSKSNLPRGRDISKSVNKGDALVYAKVPASDLTGHAPLTSHPVPLTNAGNGNGEVSASEKGKASILPNDGVVLSSSKENGDAETIANLGLSKDPERIRREQAVIKAQAAFRGYLARRAFRTLKGIIRLQALGRGHLVRRQAVATLCCVQGIVKFQALVRGQNVRRSNIGTEVQEKLSARKYLEAKTNSSGLQTSNQAEKLSKNVFVCKFQLLASSPTSMPLHLQYGLGEPNSAWGWLERWTHSHFWEPVNKSKKIIDSKSQKNGGTLQTVESDRSRPKRSVRKSNNANFENGSTPTTLVSDKPKLNLKKVSSHPVDSIQVHPKTASEKTKSKSRKNLKSASDTSDRLEVNAEKPKHGLRKASSSDTPEQGTTDSLKKIKKDVAARVSKQSDIETGKKPPAENEPVDAVDDQTLDDLHCVVNNGKSENIPEGNKDVINKDNDISYDDQKTSQRRSSLPGKHDYQENGSHNTPRLPSYMAATESAKAKLRALGSPRFGQDEADKNGIARRHSLPSSINGKFSSWSPRAQKLVQASGKGVFKSDRSLMSSRDSCEKLMQPEWRR